jgi:histidinol-phosphate aminotransferase
MIKAMKYTTIEEHPALAPATPIRALPAYSGGRDAAAVRRDTGYQGPVVKLAANEGSEGPFPSACAALEKMAPSAQRYPAAYAVPVGEALARFHGADSSEVMVGGGGCALLAHLSSAYLEPGDEVVFGRPTFHLYRLDALRMGATAVPVPLAADGSYDLPALRAAVTPKTRLLYVCTPNNPTGGMVPRAQLEAFINELPPRVLPIIDEAYFEYMDHPDYPDPIHIARRYRRPVVVLRTFSKIYGLAGLRLGYALAPPAVVATCRRIQNPYEVTRAAQVAAVASLEHPEELERRRQQNLAGRQRLFEGLRALGFQPFPSQANFACVRVGEAKAISNELEHRGVIVRPLDAMGDPGSLRITVGTPAEIETFLHRFAEVMRTRRPACSEPHQAAS